MRDQLQAHLLIGSGLIVLATLVALAEAVSPPVLQVSSALSPSSAAAQRATFHAAEPVGLRRVMLLGEGEPADVTLSLDGRPLDINSFQSFNDPARTYLNLEAPLHAGTLQIQSGNRSFIRSLRALTLRLEWGEQHPISPDIYGLAFAEPELVADLGVSLGRWGGNTTSTYNPVLNVENAGADWFFENRPTTSAQRWIEDLERSGAPTLFTAPALDFVARDGISYSYSVSTYGPQEAVDPWKPDAGNGKTPEGVRILDHDPTDAGIAWDPDQLEAWFETLDVAPTLVAIDNELDICSSTHQDFHPWQMSYAELLERFLLHAAVVRRAVPGAAVAGPVSCCWWYYWNSESGAADKSAHGEVDFLPWFLTEVAHFDQQAGSRHLDYLDLHYYPEGVFNAQADPETRALRLRSTRSLWDPTYTDESWIGSDAWATVSQPNPHQVQLIPRMRTLIDAHYPGTRLILSEWSWGGEADVSGWLALADVLGIFGRERLDAAAFWTFPGDDGWPPVVGAFQLFRDPLAPFGNRFIGTDSILEPDLLGLYAAQDDSDRLTVVGINKDPSSDLLITLEGLPEGPALVRRFGGGLRSADALRSG